MTIALTGVRTALHAQAARSLPDYLVPSVFVPLARLAPARIILDDSFVTS